jgi:streptogramin lyase
VSPSGIAWLNMQNFSSGNISIGSAKNKEAMFLLDDKKETVWVGTSSMNLMIYYNRLTRNFYSLDNKKDRLLETSGINSLAQDNRGNIWIGADAICRLNPQLQKADTLIEYLPTQKNRKKGFAVMSDSRGDIWVMLNEDGFARITGTFPEHIRPENLLFDFKSNLFPTLLQDKIFMPTETGIGYFDVNNLTGSHLLTRMVYRIIS